MSGKNVEFFIEVREYILLPQTAERRMTNGSSDRKDGESH